MPLLLAAAVVPAVDSKPQAGAAQPQFDYDSALAISQGALGNQVRDLAFTGVNGESVSLNGFSGKPVILSLVYTSCYQICPMTTRHLAKMVDKAAEALGEDSFSVAVIGFDTAFDTPQAMRHFATKQGVDDRDWHFLSVSEQQIGDLMEDVGFVYYPSSNGFDHIIQATILDSNGKVYRQVYGQAFETPLLVDPLIELILGRPQPEETLLDGLTAKIKLFCTTYDPVRDGYYFDYSLFLGMIIGATIILVAAFFIIREYRSKREFPSST